MASEGSITFGVLETSLGTEKRQDIERTFKIYKVPRFFFLKKSVAFKLINRAITKHTHID